MYLPFDQYQRYKTFDCILNKFKQEEGIKSLKILEVGANIQKNLGKFLVDDDIYYTDLEIPEELNGDSHFFSANACNMPEIDDNAYDIVVAGDVFEHIPIELRCDFIKEINRVAKYFAIVSFPYKTYEHEMAERRTNQYYKYFAGTDYIWLKEHIENGLPSREKLESILKEKNISYASICHGNVEIWEMLTKLHFYCTVYADLIEYREMIDQYYIDNVYSCDINGDCYRVFYIMSGKLDSNECGHILEDIFNDKEFEKQKIKLEEMVNEIHSMADLKLNIKNNQDIKRNVLDIEGFTASEIVNTTFNIYYDYGNGYNEQCRTTIMPDINNQQEFVFLEVPENVKTLRIDPVEGKYCILTDVEIYDSDTKKLEFVTNGIYCDGMYVFDTFDSIIEVDVQKICRLSIKYRIYTSTNIYLNTIIKNYLAYRSNYLRNEVLEYNGKSIRLTANDVERYLTEIETKINSLEKMNSDYRYQKEKFMSEAEWKLVKPIYNIFKGIKNTTFMRNLYAFHSTRKTMGIKKALLKTKKVLLKERGNIEYEINTVIRYNAIIISDSKKEHHRLVECLKSLEQQEQPVGTKVILDYEVGADVVKKFSNVDFIYTDDIVAKVKSLIEILDGAYVILSYDNVIFQKNMIYNLSIGISETKPDVVYFDEIRKNKEYYKPDYSPDLLLSNYYWGDVLITRKGVLENCKNSLTISKDLLFELALEVYIMTEEVLHIPVIGFDSLPDENIDYKNRQSMLQKLMEKTSQVTLDEHFKFFDLQYYKNETEPYVSIIIPTKDKAELTNDCVQSILEKSDYQNYEIIILDNRSTEEETFKWFEIIQKQDARVKVIKADFEFNWSKLNNFGMSKAKGEVYIFLNNDTLIISDDWIKRLVGHALRDDVGVVGPLLLYDDDTIQHAGVVVGIGGWADHIYKALPVSEYDGIFVSPFCTRDVIAVTGACMVISRKTIEKIGLFDDEFIICGSDVEICLRAYQYGLNNIYDPFTRLYHLESKSRDSYIPEIDFKKSYEAYTEYRENGDPYYNINLDLQNPIPTKGDEVMRLDWLINKMRNNRFAIKVYKYMLDTVSQKNVVSFIAETQELKARPVDGINNLRINLLVPSVDSKVVFGGISTAYKFFEEFCQKNGIQKRIIVTDDQVDVKTMIDLPGYVIVEPEDDITEGDQIVGMGNRANKTIPVFKNDIFMATSWWSAYIAFEVLRWQADRYKQDVKKLIYFVQDYEPGFYPWSSRYLMADSTYKSDVPTIAIYNSYVLSEYFKKNGYQFANEFYFEPTLNSELKKVLMSYKNSLPRKKQILLYGRPSVQRNAFELIVDALKIWCDMQEDIDEWRIISAGEVFDNIELKNGKKIEVLGKLSLEEYAKTMLETKVGISLMVSPHPSYPPLEMSTFGIKVITNTYDNKNLNGFNNNIIALSNCSGQAIANKLFELCSDNNLVNDVVLEGDYVNNETVWTDIMENIYEVIK